MDYGTLNDVAVNDDYRCERPNIESHCIRKVSRIERTVMIDVAVADGELLSAIRRVLSSDKYSDPRVAVPASEHDPVRFDHTGRPYRGCDVAYHVPLRQVRHDSLHDVSAVVVKLANFEEGAEHDELQRVYKELLRYAKAFPVPFHFWVSPENYRKLPTFLVSQPNTKLFIEMVDADNFAPQVVVHTASDDSYEFYWSE